MEAVYALKDNIKFVIEAGTKSRKDYLLPVAAIYGSNAGGKSNVIRALRDVARNVCERNDWMQNDPFALVEYLNGIFEHSINLLIEKYEYIYSYTVNTNSVANESLKRKAIGCKNFDVIFLRENDKVTAGTILDGPFFNTITNAAININYLILNTLGTMDIPDCSNIYNWCKSILTVTSNKSDEERWEHLNNYASNLVLDSFAKERLTDFINKFDPAIVGVHAFDAQNDVAGKNKHMLGVGHRFNDAKGFADIRYFSVPLESNGTQKILELYPILADALDNGKPLLIDELDTMLHPLVFKKIVSMFNDKKTNPKNAQLIFAAHNTEVMNREDLRRDEIHIVEKDNDGVSTIFRLSDVEDENGNKIRSDARYDRLYLEGLLGSVPNNFHDAKV
jgi:hypothetical protein